ALPIYKVRRAIDCDSNHMNNSVYDGNHLVVDRRSRRLAVLPKTQMCCSCVVIRGRNFYIPDVPLRFCGCGTEARGNLTPGLAHVRGAYSWPSAQGSGGNVT